MPTTPTIWCDAVSFHDAELGVLLAFVRDNLLGIATIIALNLTTKSYTAFSAEQ